MRTTLALMAALASPAAAQVVDTTAASAAEPAPLVVGATIRDSKGQDLGRIEGLLAGSDGGVRQLLVRTGGIARVRSSLKAIPAAGLSRREGELFAPLTREEAQSLPDVDPPAPATTSPE